MTIQAFIGKFHLKSWISRMVLIKQIKIILLNLTLKNQKLIILNHLQIYMIWIKDSRKQMLFSKKLQKVLLYNK